MPAHLAGPLYEWQLHAGSAGGLTIPGAVQVDGPAGTHLRLTAFDDGDVWRARLAANSAGAWHWRTVGGALGTLEVLVDEHSRWNGPLTISEDRRHLAQLDGTPWLWLGDTAWSIVFKGRPEEWRIYLDRRVEQGYSVLQVTLLPWRWDWTDCEGNRAFHNSDPARPNHAYFRRYDQFLQMAAERGLVVCLMLIWGGPRPLLPAVHFSLSEAVAFTRYAVARFAAFPIMWSISGDAEYIDELPKWDAVGGAVVDSDPYDRPTTNHLPPSMNWCRLHSDAAWHDFHMVQTGHRRAAVADIADLPAAYARIHPTKAFVNGEPWYEAHPSRDTREYGPPFTAYDARYAFWVSILSGAGMGHTYGSQGIWNWKHPGDSEQEVAGPQIGPLWTEALDHPGAAQCGRGAQLLRSIDWWRLRPAPERVQMDPALGDLHHRPFCAIADERTWLLYAPEGAGRLTLKGIRSATWAGQWCDPRTGERQPVGPIDIGITHCWQAPPSPSRDDWVLLLRCPSLS